MVNILAVESTLTLADVNRMTQDMISHHGQKDASPIRFFKRYVQIFHEELANRTSSIWTSFMHDALTTLTIVESLINMNNPNEMCCKVITGLLALTHAMNKPSSLDFLRKNSLSLFDDIYFTARLNPIMMNVLRFTCLSASTFWLAVDQSIVIEDTKVNAKEAASKTSYRVRQINEVQSAWMSLLISKKIDVTFDTIVSETNVTVLTNDTTFTTELPHTTVTISNV